MSEKPEHSKNSLRVSLCSMSLVGCTHSVFALCVCVCMCVCDLSKGMVISEGI